MNTTYNIKNFRVFGEEGAEAKLAPVTILTGCNSSGKSSIAKSLLLLDNYLRKVKKSSESKDVFDLANHTMDFTEYPLNLLGRFDKVVNSSSTLGEIEFRFTSYEDLEVVLAFVTRGTDILNRGYLKSMVILKKGVPVFTSGKEVSCLNTIPFLAEYLENTLNNLDINYLFDHFFEGDIRSCEAVIKEYENEHKVSYASIKWAIENDSLFNVPILEKIGHLNKGNFQEKADELLASVYNIYPGIKICIHRLSEVFNESNCASFNDFFKMREKQLMNYSSNVPDDEPALGPSDWSNIYSCIYLGDEAWFILVNSLSKEDSSLAERIQNNNFNFRFLLTTLTIIGDLIGLNQDNQFSEKITGGNNMLGNPTHLTVYYLWEDFKKYVNDQLRKALIPSWCSSLSYVGSSRIDVKRLYTLDSKTDFARLLNRYFDARRDFKGLKEYEEERRYEPDAFMNKWLKNFGICDYVTLDLDPEGLGVSIKLHKGERTSLLADEGYGITQLFSILLEIETEIQNAFHHFLVKGWYGQNYVYVTDMNTDKVLFPEQTIIIEEPEIHLHPKFQSLLVDMFLEAQKEYNIHFIIETHSEYLIRRLQLRVAEKKIPATDVSVIYVDQDSHPYNMGMAEDGKFSREFGTGFFDEADNAAIQLFDLIND